MARFGDWVGDCLVCLTLLLADGLPPPDMNIRDGHGTNFTNYMVLTTDAALAAALSASGR